MTAPDPTLITWAAHAAMAVLGLAIILAFVRLVLGPSLPDRVVALDLMATLVVGVIGVYAIRIGTSVLLMVAMVVALVNFVGTIAFSYYLMKRGKG